MARLIDVDEVDYENIMCSQAQLHWLNAIIENQPTVDAVPVVHGRWIAFDDDCEESEDQEEARSWGCSACHEIVEYDDWTDRSRLTKFCPNCGAKMDMEAEG